MDTIEKMAAALKNKVRESQGRLEYVIKLLDQADVIITTYQAEKTLLEKTQKHHEHGTVTPSCVGCPTAEAMIEKDMVFVQREDFKWKVVTILYYLRVDGEKSCMLSQHEGDYSERAAELYYRDAEFNYQVHKVAAFLTETEE